MKDNNKGSIIILTIIGIATLLIAVIGATFAYFTAQIKYVTPPTTTEIKSTTMIVEYETQNSINYTGAYPGRPDAAFEDNKLKFTLTSHQNLTLETDYDVYLVIDKNEFLKDENNGFTDEVVYVTTPPTTLGITPTRIVKNVAITNNTAGEDGKVNYRNIINEETYNPEVLTIKKKDPQTQVETSEEVQVGLIPSNIIYEDNITDDDKIRVKVGSGKLASHQSSDTWQVEIWVKETDTNQNYNQGKNLQAHIDIVVTDGKLSHEVTTQ